MNKIRVAIFEDNRYLRESLFKLLETSDQFTCVGAFAHCERVIENIEETQPDVILMDNWIPDIGGVKAIRLLKSYPQFSQIPVIFFSANNNVGELAKEAGADYSLQKPFDISELEELVSSAALKQSGV